MKKGREKGRDVLGNSSPCYVKPEPYKKEGDVQLFEVGALEGWAGRRDNTPHVLSSGISQLALFWRYDCDGGYCP